MQPAVSLQGGVTALHIASYKELFDSVKVLLTARKKTEETVDIQDDVSPNESNLDGIVILNHDTSVGDDTTDPSCKAKPSRRDAIPGSGCQSKCPPNGR